MILDKCDNTDLVNKIQSGILVFKILCFVLIIVIIITIVVDYFKFRRNENDRFDDFFRRTIIKLLSSILIAIIPSGVLVITEMINPNSLLLCDSYSNDVIDNEDNNKDENESEIVGKIKNKIKALWETLSSLDYDKIKEEIEDIKDGTTKEELKEEIEKIKKYIDLKERIEKLKSEFDLSKYVEIYKEIKEIADEKIKDKLKELIDNLKKGKPLDVVSGFKEENYDSLKYFIGIPGNALENMPLVVYLTGHQGYSRYNSFNDLGINSSKYTSETFIYLAPDWESNQTLTKVKSLIDYIVQEFQINKKKIIVTGFSYGGGATWKIVSMYPNYFSAAVPVSGTSNDFKASSFKNTAVWGISGTEEACGDTISNYVSSINSIGGNAKSSKYSGGHSDMANIFLKKEIIEWAFNQ